MKLFFSCSAIPFPLKVGLHHLQSILGKDLQRLLHFNTLVQNQPSEHILLLKILNYESTSGPKSKIFNFHSQGVYVLWNTFLDLKYFSIYLPIMRLTLFLSSYKNICNILAQFPVMVLLRSRRNSSKGKISLCLPQTRGGNVKKR